MLPSRLSARHIIKRSAQREASGKLPIFTSAVKDIASHDCASLGAYKDPWKIHKIYTLPNKRMHTISTKTELMNNWPLFAPSESRCSARVWKLLLVDV